MPGSEYYRKQAQLCAQLALLSRDPTVVARYNTTALEHLAKAVEVDGGEQEMSPPPSSAATAAATWTAIDIGKARPPTDLPGVWKTYAPGSGGGERPRLS